VAAKPDLNLDVSTEECHTCGRARMPLNLFDKASRFTAKLDPEGFFSWLFRLPRDAFVFRGWLNTRTIAFPSDPDRTNDTVAWIDLFSGNQAPWAFAVEFQLRPDPDMPGRLMGYFSGLWLELRPDKERGSRFQVGAAVVNMTGHGNSSRDMRWPEADVITHLKVVERNLEEELAEELLSSIEAGGHSLCLLPWISLMTGADNPVLVDRWKRLAEGEPDSRRKAEFGVVALIFAEKAGRKELWQEKLKGWNVEESTVAEDFIKLGEARGEAKGEARGEVRGEARGRIEEARSVVFRIGVKRFGPVPSAIQSALHTISDRERLERIVDRVLEATDWNDLLATA